MTNPTKERVALYARISLDRSGEAAGVERQVKECEKLAKANGLVIAGHFIDNDKSAYSGKRRPEWSRLLDALASGEATSVVAWANDRLYRRTRDQLDLMEAVKAAGGRIVTMKDGEVDPSSAEGCMRMGILANVAEFESARKAERVTAASAARAAKGRPHGRAPYGWTGAAGAWQLDPDAAPIIAEAARRVLAGDSVTTICHDFDQRGVPTPNGGDHWWPMTLRKLLRRPSTAGLRDLRGEVVAEGDWPAIVPRDQWESILVALRSPTPQRKPRRYLLSGLLRCGVDGDRMTGHAARTRRYKCVRCSQTIHADRLDELVTETVITTLDTPRLAKRINAAKSDPGEGAALRALADADERLKALAAMFGAGDIRLDEYRAAQQAASAARAAAEAKLSDKRGTRALAAIAGTSGGLRTAWDGASVGWRRQVLDAVLERIDVGPIVGSGWTPERVSLVWRRT